jgi:UDP-glucose 4-epimerase
MSLFKDYNEYKDRSVLITGGLGFIGSSLARRLVQMGNVKVILLDAFMSGQGGNLFNIDDIKDQVELHTSTMCDSSVVNHLVGGVDFIFNLAGSVSHLDSMLYPQYDLEHNCAAHLVLLEACRSFNPHVKIVFTSTRQVYGKPVYLPLDEQHRIAPLDINGINKLAAEHYHLLYNRVYGIHTVCLRLTNTYGPRQLLQHDRQGFIAWFIRQAIEGKVIELYGEGRQKRDLNYIDDVVEALLLAGASEAAEGEVFNLGNDEAVSLQEIAELLISITGRGSVVAVPFPPERQLIEIGNIFLSYKKIESVLGWKPTTSLQKGLAHTVAFYQKHHAHYWGPDDDSLH